MTQLDLLYSPRFDPDTSRVAAEKSGAFRAGHEAKIYCAIADSKYAITYRQIAALANLEPVAVARRLKAMEERGLITRQRHEVTGEYRQQDGMALWVAR